MSTLLLILAAALGAPAPQAAPPASCPAHGRVTDATGAALPGVIVATLAGSVMTVTDAAGEYCLAAGAGRVLLRFTLAGFGARTIEVLVPARGGVRHDVAMTPAFADAVVVTATRTARLAESVPVRTEVIGRRAMTAAGARTLADAVEYTTGIRVENNCQNCNFSQIRLLGLEGPYTQILVDGQPIVSALAQVYGIEQIPARMIDRIEVVKGGGSALYGAGAVGGVVNIIPREARETGGTAELRAGAGWGLNAGGDWASASRQTLLTTFVQHDRVDPRDVDGDDFTEVSRRGLLAAGARATRFAAGGRARLTFDLSRIEESRRGGNRLDAPPHEADIAESIDSRRTSAAVAFTHSVAPRVDYRLTVAGEAMDRDTYYGTGGDPNAYGDTTSRTALADAQVNHYLGAHTLSWGGQLAGDRLADRQPAYGRALRQRSSNRAAFVQHDWTIAPGWQLLSGARADWHSALARPVVSPRFALMVSPSDPLDIRVSLARGFRAPQVFDEDLHLSSVAGEVRFIRLDPDLRDERATTAMAGFEWKPAAGRGQALVEANVFHTRLEHLFHAVEADDPATPDLELVKTNLGGARVYGVEVNLGWGIGDDLVIQGGFVAQRARFDEPEPDFGSRDFFRTPRHYASASVRWSSHHGWEAFAGLKATGRMRAPHYAGFVDADRLESTPRFLTLDASAGRRILAGERVLVVSAWARNLTNAYQRDLDRGPLRDAAYVYGPRFPRAFGASLRVEF